MLHAAQDEFQAPSLVVATGGLSIPKMGATSFGYELARQFGLKIVEPRPALVPLLFNARDRRHYCELTGVSTEVVAAIGKQAFREKMLFTHRGLSGPAILQISSYWKPLLAVNIDLAPGARLHRFEFAMTLRPPRHRRPQSRVPRHLAASVGRPLARSAPSCRVDQPCPLRSLNARRTTGPSPRRH